MFKILSQRTVREVERLGYKAIWLTVDAVVTGNREADVRSRWESDQLDGKEEMWKGEGGDEEDEKFLLGTAGALIVNDDRDMTWEKAGAGLWQ